RNVIGRGAVSPPTRAIPSNAPVITALLEEGSTTRRIARYRGIPRASADSRVEMGTRRNASSEVRAMKGIMIVDKAMTPVVVLRSEEHTSELQSRSDLVCRLLLSGEHRDLLSFPTRRSSDLPGNHRAARGRQHDPEDRSIPRNPQGERRLARRDGHETQRLLGGPRDEGDHDRRQGDDPRGRAEIGRAHV